MPFQQVYCSETTLGRSYRDSVTPGYHMAPPAHEFESEAVQIGYKNKWSENVSTPSLHYESNALLATLKL
eukprot:5561286-Amphidinium_carterae.1